MNSCSHHRAGSVSSLPSTLFRRSLPGSASELRYPQGGGSLPSGYSSSSGGVVVRRAHRGRWGPRDDGNKVRVLQWDAGDVKKMCDSDDNFLFPFPSMESGIAALCWVQVLRVVWRVAALMTRTTGRLCSDRSCSRPADRPMYRLWPSCYRSNWRPSTKRLSGSYVNYYYY